MNHGDVDRRVNRWWRRRNRFDEEPCEDIRRFWSVSSIKHETTSQVMRCNDERATLQWCKSSITWDVRNDYECFHSVDAVANVDLLIDTKIASANTNMTSPTGDTAMLATAIVSFCSCTDKCSFHPLAGPRPIRSSSRMGMVPKILCRSNTFWFRQSRKHKRDGASRQQGSIQLKVVGC